MLDYKIRQAGDVTILDLAGRMSVGEALAFGPGSGTVLGDVIRELANKGHRKILLNLRDVKYIDSSGMGVCGAQLHQPAAAGWRPQAVWPHPTSAGTTADH